MTFCWPKPVQLRYAAVLPVRAHPSTRQPLFWAALAYAAGIAAGVHFWRPMTWWLAAGAVFLLAAIRFGLHCDQDSSRAVGWRSCLGWILALSSLTVLGAWCLEAADSAVQLPDLSAFTTGSPTTVTVRVIRDGVIRGEGRWLRQSIDVETEELVAADRSSTIRAALRISIYDRGVEASASGKDSISRLSFPVFTYGQRLRFPVKLREPRNFQNPGASDFRGYLLRQGIVAIGSVSSEKIELLPGIAGSRWGWWCSRARRGVLHQIHALWPPGEAELFDAILIGERSFVPRDTNSVWQRTGLYHLLVVSGMKVGILAYFILWLARCCRVGDFAATVAAVLLSVGYGFLAEMATPVQRSILMLAIFLAGRLLYREHALLNSLGAAALILLVSDPRALFDPSFQLTFFCVLAIAGLALPILERTSQSWRRGLRELLQTGYDFHLSPRLVQFRLEMRMLAEQTAQLLPLAPERGRYVTAAGLCLLLRAGLVVYDTIVLSFMTQLAMVLPMAVYFHRAMVVGMPANAIAVPLTGFLMPSALVAVLLARVWMPLARIPACVASWSLKGIVWSMKLFASLRLSDLRLPTPSPLPVVVIVIAFVLAILLVRRRNWQAWSGVAALAGAAVWFTLFPARLRTLPGVLEVTAIDVGQAESTLLITPQGRTILVDAGGSLGPWESDFDFGEDVVAPYLWSRGFRHLDALVLTHAHSDHIGGMRGVAAAFHPREFWLGPNPETPTLHDLRRRLERDGTKVIRRSAGEQFEYGGALFRVLAPPAAWQTASSPRNNDSLVLLVTFGRTSALLTGDAEKQVEPEIEAQNPRADVLKVAHNGSATSTTPEFLASVQPRFALIHVGVHNSFGHPRREVLERLAEANVETYRTDMVGATTLLLDGNSVQVGTPDGEPRPESVPKGR